VPALGTRSWYLAVARAAVKYHDLFAAAAATVAMAASATPAAAAAAGEYLATVRVDVAFVDFSIEVCDGLPSDVESGALTSDRYCPWSARVVEMTPLVSR
jgi:hypothetical protein